MHCIQISEAREQYLVTPGDLISCFEEYTHVNVELD